MSDQWQVSHGPPPARRVPPPRPIDQDVMDVVKLARESGEWVRRAYASATLAQTAWRRIRYYVRTRHPELQVQSQRSVKGKQTELWIRIKKRPNRPAHQERAF